MQNLLTSWSYSDRLLLYIGHCVVIVTHDLDIADAADEVYHTADGILEKAS